MKSTIKRLKPNDLQVDERVQRGLNKLRARRMADALNLDAIGVLTVSDRGGKYFVLDGQHRCEALKLAGRGDVLTPCEVFDNLTVEQEASTFLDRQKFHKVQALHEYRVQLTRGDEATTEIDAIVQRHGWTVGDGKGVHRIAAARALWELWKRTQSGALVDRVIGVITAAWGYDYDGVTASLLTGFGEFLHTYGDQVVDGRLSTKLAKNGQPVALIGSARSRQSFSRGTVSNAVVNELKDLYNRGLAAKNKLL